MTHETHSAIVDPEAVQGPSRGIAAAKARPRRILGLPTEFVGDTQADRDAWAQFLEAWTGRDLDYHMRQRTSGLSFAFACWLEGKKTGMREEAAAREAEDLRRFNLRHKAAR